MILNSLISEVKDKKETTVHIYLYVTLTIISLSTLKKIYMTKDKRSSSVTLPQPFVTRIPSTSRHEIARHHLPESSLEQTPTQLSKVTKARHLRKQKSRMTRTKKEHGLLCELKVSDGDATIQGTDTISFS